MTEMRFSQNRIDARAGQSVLMPDQSSRLTISFDAPGTYLFLCTIPGHAAAGMTGAVFVSP